MFYEFLFQESRPLLFVECNQNPVFLADLAKELCIRSRAAEEFTMPLIPDSCAVQLFDQFIVVEVVVQIEGKALRRRFSLLRAR